MSQDQTVSNVSPDTRVSRDQGTLVLWSRDDRDQLICVSLCCNPIILLLHNTEKLISHNQINDTFQHWLYQKYDAFYKKDGSGGWGTLIGSCPGVSRRRYWVSSHTNWCAPDTVRGSDMRSSLLLWLGTRDSVTEQTEASLSQLTHVNWVIPLTGWPLPKLIWTHVQCYLQR